MNKYLRAASIFIGIFVCFVFVTPVHASVVYGQSDDSVTGDKIYDTGNPGYVIQPLGTGLVGNASTLTVKYNIQTSAWAGGAYPARPVVMLSQYPDSSYGTADWNAVGPFVGFNGPGSYSTGNEYDNVSLTTSLSNYDNPTLDPTKYYALTINAPSGGYTTWAEPLGTLGGCFPRARITSSNYASGTTTTFKNIFFQINDSSGYISSSTNCIASQSFYAQIQNIPSASWNLRDASSTSSNIIKTLPKDWIVYVASTTDASGNQAVANGYQWYYVTDPIDNISGWMAGANATSGVQYLQFDSAKQTALQASSTNYIATSSRPDLILKAIDHYYNDTSSSHSLYSSDDGSNSISDLKNGGYEDQIIPGIAAQEDGGATLGLNNENISSDYGHGVMQITFSPSHWDNRGIASNITIPDCEAVSSSDYTNCYTAADSTSPYLRHYQPYGGTPGQPEYEYYNNTEQSIYSNIKDGMQILANKYNVYSYITTSTTTDGITFSADDRKNILTTENYNGSNCGYVDDVASRLDNITSYFSNATTSNIIGLVSKMHTVGTDVVCADLHSPAVLAVQDSSGKTAGVIKGEVKNDFPLAIVDRDEKVVKILASKSDNYKFRVEGTGNADYGIDITIKHGKEVETFHGKGIPTHVGEVHTFMVDKKALKEGRKDAVTVQIDAQGNGKAIKMIKIGNNVTGEEFKAAESAQNAQ